jgi:hypothetical protein
MVALDAEVAHEHVDGEEGCAPSGLQCVFVWDSQDYRNIEDGMYKLPWDMTTRGHRQFSPFWVARRSAQA